MEIGWSALLVHRRRQPAGHGARVRPLLGGAQARLQGAAFLGGLRQAALQARRARRPITRNTSSPRCRSAATCACSTSATARWRRQTCRAPSTAGRPGSASWCCSRARGEHPVRRRSCCGSCSGRTASTHVKPVVGEVVVGFAGRRARACAAAMRSAASTASRSATRCDATLGLLDAVSDDGEAVIDGARPRRRQSAPSRSRSPIRTQRHKLTEPDSAAARPRVSISGRRRFPPCSARSIAGGPAAQGRSQAGRSRSSRSTARRSRNFNEFADYVSARPGQDIVARRAPRRQAILTRRVDRRQRNRRRQDHRPPQHRADRTSSVPYPRRDAHAHRARAARARSRTRSARPGR